ncbi:GntR family transcriptional regulator [Neobacillus niacini]|uniref:GntR family transcriptional regulator n=1 Tax=Neobacillus niacini TaxID=86668 RepID=UPI0005ED7525|nr:GntR family transcriptional regulator [Neobacillus niacini]
MSFNKVKDNEIANRTLSQQIADSITMEIIEGQYKPGERLYEMKLTEHFGTSRAPIREALYILEKEGIVERSPRRGVFVKNYTSKELFDLYDVIYRLEEIALEKASESISESQLIYLKDLIGQMESEAEQKKIRNYFSLMEKLQISFFEVTGNEVLKEVYTNLITRITRFRFMSLSHPLSLEHSIEEYKSIVDGLIERNYTQVKFHLKRKEKRALEIWKQKGF